jgi:hypothetical protein
MTHQSLKIDTIHYTVLSGYITTLKIKQKLDVSITTLIFKVVI